MSDVATDIAAAREPFAALVSQEQAIITNRTNEDLMQDLDNLMRDRQNLLDYANDLESKFGDDEGVLQARPQISHVRFGSKNAGRPNLMDAYAAHSRRETQSSDKDGSLIQLRDLERQGAEDPSLIKSLVTREPDGNKPGHDYQQLAFDRQHLAKAR